MVIICSFPVMRWVGRAVHTLFKDNLTNCICVSFTCRLSFHQLLLKGIDAQTTWVRIIEALVLCGLALLLGLKFDLSFVFGLTGSLTASNVMFVFPPLFYMKVRESLTPLRQAILTTVRITTLCRSGIWRRKRSPVTNWAHFSC